MQDASIITDSQITTTDIGASVSSLRNLATGNLSPLATNDTQLNITIVMTNGEYPAAPRIGKLDIIELESVNVLNYEVYYTTPSSGALLIPYHSDPTVVGVAESFAVIDDVTFPNNLFVDTIVVVLNKDPFTPNEAMQVKLDVFACFISKR